MNGRIIELAKNPELFQIKDLELLNSEINKHPYIQSLRALHLLGTHRLKPENYSNELSTTAAYTTDKKILYQLINSIKETKPSVESTSERIIEQETAEEKPKSKFTEINSKVVETPKAVYVNGELNRILFEGEEDFLDRENETIDLESTLESGQIVTQKPDSESNAAEQPEFAEAKDAENFSKEKIIEEEIISEEKPLIENPSELSFHETEEFLPFTKVDSTLEDSQKKEVQDFKESEDAENFSKETIIKEDIISEEKAIIQDESKLSFHATEAFLPEVKMVSNQEKVEIREIAKPAVNKYEEEMKRLIAQVEAKMKASKKQKSSAEVKDETSESTDINFSETQTFEIQKTEEKETDIEVVMEKEVIVKEEPVVAETLIAQPTKTPQEPTATIAEPVQENKPEWKPMSFSNNTPDALISKKTEESPVKKDEVNAEQINTIKEEEKDSTEDEPSSTERPIFNVSFFTQNVSALNKEKEEEETPIILKEEKAAEIIEDSNVPDFINTWQNWLKIDRNKEQAQEKIEISITEIKNKVIENFIEKEPRISKLKEESDFVIKERNDDISHLMTETLANLYTEQKLYAKAIKSYGILSTKYPEKKTYFDDKIKQVKELRQTK